MQRHLPIKRVLSLGAGILLGCWVLGVLIHMQGESQASLHSEARNRAQALVAYAARDMKRWIKEEKSSELERLARDLAAEPEILDATLYDGRGIPLAQSEQAVPLESLLPIGLALGCTLKRAVAKDTPLTFDDVQFPAGRLVDRLYAEQEGLFAPDAASTSGFRRAIGQEYP